MKNIFKNSNLLSYLKARFGETRVELGILKIKNLLKKNIVVIISVIVAIITCFFVPIDKGYKSYINYKSLLCLFSLMLVVRGLKDCKFFGIMSGKLLDKIHSRRLLCFVLVFLPAFFALFITNDIATLTFIPFSIILLSTAEEKELIPYVVILQTMAVSLSGLISPIGNSQNLFLIDYYRFDFLWFVKNLWPLAIAGYGLTFILCFFIKDKKLDAPPIGQYKLPVFKVTTYLVMFVFVILSIFDVLPYYIITPIILVLMLIINPKSYKKANYGVIIMFTAFFIIAGNFMRIEKINDFLESFVAGNEFFSAILGAEILTGNPIAIIFPHYATNVTALMYGLNVGKFGTTFLSNYMVVTLERKYDVKKHFVIKLLLMNFLYLGVLMGVGAMYLYL